MSPGKDLDAQVARAVFGRATLGKDGLWFDAETKRGIPNYSTDIAAAWEVVERVKTIKPDGSEFGISTERTDEFVVVWSDGVWLAEWRPINFDGVAILGAKADTAPHAICLAALKAVETARVDSKPG